MQNLGRGLGDIGAGLGKGIGEVGTGLGKAAETVAKSAVNAADLGIEVQQSNEYATSIAKCSDPLIKMDAAQLRELMQSDPIPVIRGVRDYSPSLIVAYQMRQIMSRYPTNSEAFNKLVECMGPTNVSEIMYRVNRFWLDAGSFIVRAIVAIVILIIVILILYTINKAPATPPAPPPAKFSNPQVPNYKLSNFTF